MRRVLLLTSGDPALAQLAAALLRHAGARRFDVHAAATCPSDVSAAASVLAELGIAEPPRVAPLDRYAGQAFDEAITLCPAAPT